MQFWKQPESEGVEGGNICQLLAQRSHRLHSDQDIRTDRLVSYINAESQTIAWTHGSINQSHCDNVRLRVPKLSVIPIKSTNLPDHRTLHDQQSKHREREREPKAVRLFRHQR